ncbi:protein yellow isoform X2 [Cylas formicarius]|uniref:protein yellow isoform X2 n=1 Tax=Cylas formicarius TaxID=197179 RepID=UPI002958A4F8|nr:protein yellow isoform X2 [Cylas formicarius]
MHVSRTTLIICTVVAILTIASTMDNLRVAYQWKTLDFDYSSPRVREEAINKKEFIPENNIPVGLEVVGKRLFLTIPRWKRGVAASLAYIDRTTAPTDSPKLRPYPNWDAHTFIGRNPPDIVSPFRIRADACDRLWVLDTGTEENLTHRKTRLLIYNLRNDVLMRTYDIPGDQMKDKSFFINIAVEDHDCQDTYAYLADVASPGLVVYTYKDNRSWLVKHNYFNIDPLASELNVSGIAIQDWDDGVFGLALSSPDPDGYSTLYFHPMISFDEFAVSTKILRDEDKAKNPANYYDFRHLGSRGPKGQSGASFLDTKSGVLFYTLINLNAVICWRTPNVSYTMESQGRIFMSNETMVFPNDIKVDNDSNLWVLSDKLPVFLYSSLDYGEVNFRIMTAKVEDAIRDTACAPILETNPVIMDKLTPIIGKTAKAASRCCQIKLSLGLFVLAVASALFK